MKKVAIVVGMCCVAATACSERPTEPAGPAVELHNQQAPSSPSGCPSFDALDSQVRDLLPRGGLRESVEERLNGLERSLRARRPEPAEARAKALALVDWMLHKYEQGRLTGGQSTVTQARLAQFLNGLLCVVGLPQVFGPGSLGPDGAAAFIYPTTPDTNVVTDTKWAGVHVPSASVIEPTLVTIQRLPDFPGPLLTQLDQYPIYYEFHATTTSFVQDVTVGVCVADNVAPPDPTRLRVAHNVPPYTMGSIAILPLATASFIDCTNAPIASAATGWRMDLARARWWLGHGAAALLLPTPAYAFGIGGVGGTVRTFSPFGVVDTLGIVTPTAFTTGGRTWTGDIMDPNRTPGVQVTTPTGRPMMGIPVTFAVTAGGGSIGTASVMTDTLGKASSGWWRLGPSAGLNSVTATVPATTPGSGFAGSPLVFSATAIAR